MVVAKATAEAKSKTIVKVMAQYFFFNKPNLPNLS